MEGSAYPRDQSELERLVRYACMICIGVCGLQRHDSLDLHKIITCGALLKRVREETAIESASCAMRKQSLTSPARQLKARAVRLLEGTSTGDIRLMERER